MQKSQPNKTSAPLTASPSFVKLAMRNMVRKGSQSLSHLAITGIGFVIFIILIASIGRPHFPS